MHRLIVGSVRHHVVITSCTKWINRLIVGSVQHQDIIISWTKFKPTITLYCSK